MIGTLVKGSRFERLLNAHLHIAGALIGAGIVGLALSSLGSFLPRLISLWLLTCLCIAYGAMELGYLSLPLPETGHQVPASWRYLLPSPVTALLYGLVLGPGIGTRIASASYGALLSLVLLYGPPLQGMLVLATCGLTRAVGTVITAHMSRRNPAEGMALGYSLIQVWRSLNALLVGLLAGCLLVEAVIMTR